MFVRADDAHNGGLAEAVMARDHHCEAEVRELVSSMLDPLEYLELQNDPGGLYSYCFCDVR